MGDVDDIVQAGGIHVADRDRDRSTFIIFRYHLIINSVPELTQDNVTKVLFNDPVAGDLQISVNGKRNVTAFDRGIGFLFRGKLFFTYCVFGNTADIVYIKGVLAAAAAEDLLLGSLDAGIADRVALAVERVSALIGLIVFLQKIFRYFSGISDNIAEKLGVIISAHQLFFNLDAVLVRVELCLDLVDGIIRHILGKHGGDVFLVIIETEFIAGNDHFQEVQPLIIAGCL